MKTHNILLAIFACLLIFASCKNENEAEVSIDHPAHSQNSNEANAHMNTGGLQWMTIEQAAKMKNKGSKKYLVDVYTDWCGWCKVMDKKTFTDPAIQEYLKENFHVIKFNAEQKDVIDFKGKKYEWIPVGRRGVNQLAMELLGSRLSYPTLVYLDEDMNKIKSSPGFKKPEQLITELKVISGS